MNLLRGSLLVVCLALAPAAEAATIDFDSIGLPVDTFFEGNLVEDGFALAFAEMFVGSGSTSTPDLEIERLGGTGGTLTVTQSGGGLFSFASIDWQNEGDFGSPDITLDAFVGATLVGSATFTNPSLTYATFGPGALAGVSMDRLVISAERDIEVGSFDTLVLESQTSVPEPASLTLLGLGLAGMGVCRRRQRKT